MEPTRPDYAYWDTVDPVEIQHAAWLWCDLEPPPGAFQKGGEAAWPGKVLAAEGMLLRECRQMPAALARGHHLRREPTAPRSQLRDLAIQWGVTPPFLFPEVRDQPAVPASLPSIPPRTKGTLYELLAALFISGYGGIPDLETLQRDIAGTDFKEFDPDFLRDTLKKAADKLPSPR